METTWFILIGFLITMYVLLDGFDLGAGSIHLSAGKTDGERRAVLKAIGPVWDGNEVWLVAAGGALLLSFPLLYSSSLSGFYLPMFIVLWLLILRGIGVEMRGIIKNPLWHSLWDFVFFLGSSLLPFFFGVAIANVMRGVPLAPREDNYFLLPLWTTNFSPTGPEVGVLDWYTVIIGFLGSATLIMHGANYLVVKTEGGLQARSRIIAVAAWLATVGLTMIATPITFYLLPGRLGNFLQAPWGFIFPAIAVGGLLAAGYYLLKGSERGAFLGSSAFIAGMLASTAFSIYPKVLPALNPENSLTIYNASTTFHGLLVGLIWWTLGIILAIGYFIFVYRLFRGKVRVEE